MARPLPWTAVLVGVGSAVIAVERTAARHFHHFPPPPALAPDFKVVDRGIPMPAACDPGSASRLIGRALEDFNSGRARAFARAFAGHASFYPYSGAHHVGAYVVGSSVHGRGAIARVAGALHRANHGWSAFELVAPASAGQSAVYGLFVRLSLGTHAWYEKGIKVVISCDSSLVTRWVGPAYDRMGRCSAKATRSMVVKLIDAINAGDADTVDRVVAKGDAFKWYSVGGNAGQRIGDAAYDRSTLKSYIVARHEAGEHLEMRKFRFQGFTDGRRFAHFNMVLTRTARDLPSTQRIGKGALGCTFQPPQVVVWSI